MKILVVNYEYPPVGGGGGRVAAQIAGELARRGHQVRVQTSGAGELPSRVRPGSLGCSSNDWGTLCPDGAPR